jgi:hypothetical protein
LILHAAFAVEFEILGDILATERRIGGEGRRANSGWRYSLGISKVPDHSPRLFTFALSSAEA